jgi:16S rRNA (guanine(966)-N(2))-methyltransferase RsmD
VRIIAGSARGRRLTSPRGGSTRPTADRVREAVFNILAARGAAPARVLDLYAGSGAFGLEALSRGAGEALLVDDDAAACALVERNAAALGFDARARVVCRPVQKFLVRTFPAPKAGRTDDSRVRAEGRFGWIFLDPPYAALAELDGALAAIAPFLDEDGVVVAEHEARRPPADHYRGLALCDRRRYGQTAVSLYTGEP